MSEPKVKPPKVRLKARTTPLARNPRKKLNTSAPLPITFIGRILGILSLALGKK